MRKRLFHWPVLALFLFCMIAIVLSLTSVQAFSGQTAAPINIRSRTPGTQFLPSDFEKSSHSFNASEFYTSMRAVLDEQRASASAAAAERERLATLFRTERFAASASASAPSQAEQEEIARIHRLFQPRAPYQTRSASSAPLTPEQIIERDHILGLFFDENGHGRDEAALTPDEQAERERILTLFNSQPSTSPSVTAGSCTRRGFLALFSDDQLFCGTSGVTFPVIWGGDCPISACVIKRGPGDGITDSNFADIVLQGLRR